MEISIITHLLVFFVFFLKKNKQYGNLGKLEYLAVMVEVRMCDGPFEKGGAGLCIEVRLCGDLR